MVACQVYNALPFPITETIQATSKMYQSKSSSKGVTLGNGGVNYKKNDLRELKIFGPELQNLETTETEKYHTLL